MFAGFRKMPTFATAIERESNETKTKATKQKLNGALVQLVRIHACHAWGHGFESRTHRESSDSLQNRGFFIFGAETNPLVLHSKSREKSRF